MPSIAVWGLACPPNHGSRVSLSIPILTTQHYWLNVITLILTVYTGKMCNLKLFFFFYQYALLLFKLHSGRANIGLIRNFKKGLLPKEALRFPYALTYTSNRNPRPQPKPEECRLLGSDLPTLLDGVTNNALFHRLGLAGL